MTKLFLAAGVAALAISAPASAGPGGHGGGGGAVKESRAQRVAAPDRQAMRKVAADRPQRAQRIEQRQMARGDRQAGRAMRMASFDRPQKAQRAEQRQFARADRQAARMDRSNDNRVVRDVQSANRAERANIRLAERAQRAASAGALRANGNFAEPWAKAKGRGLVNNCPPGLDKKNNGCLPPGQAAKLGLSPVITPQTAAVLRSAQVDSLNRRLGYRMAAPATAASLLGLPLSQAAGILPLAPLPSSVSYLYPSTAMYDYRYGDGYVYQVDRTSNLISALIPLLAGGLLPGQTLPASYMNSYVPNSYGYNSFYPSTQNQCTRYANGVVYYVDCYTGLIQNVTPVYDSGYGVGQLLPSSYGYYNVPDQYRPYYYDTADSGYWYAPGAIYQYDPRSSLITSVAALLSPGLTIGQTMPAGYGAYNVPLGFRDTYYDSPTAMYRYANGNIYQIDPVTQLVTAIVASALS